MIASCSLSGLRSQWCQRSQSKPCLLNLLAETATKTETAETTKAAAYATFAPQTAVRFGGSKAKRPSTGHLRRRRASLAERFREERCPTCASSTSASPLHFSLGNPWSGAPNKAFYFDPFPVWQLVREGFWRFDLWLQVEGREQNRTPASRRSCALQVSRGRNPKACVPLGLTSTGG